jgi:hypothetical protein
MKKIIIVLALITIFFTSCEGYHTVSYYPNHYHTPVPTVHYVYPRPHYYYHYPQPYYNQPHYYGGHYGGGHRR